MKPSYSIPQGLHAIPRQLLDLRSDEEIDQSILSPPPVTSDKNIWFFWHSGYSTMHPYAQRNVRAWHRRLSPLGWRIRVIGDDNVSSFLDISDTRLFPGVYRQHCIDGENVGQLTSDLTRFPLLLIHGGVYADVGMLQIGDVDALWNATIANQSSSTEVVLYETKGGDDAIRPFNFFMAARPGNAYIERCHRLLIHLWGLDGGRTNTKGLGRRLRAQGVPEMIALDPAAEVAGTFQEHAEELTDYALQMWVMAHVLALQDDADNWNGPAYATQRIFVLDCLKQALLIGVLAGHSGPKQFEILSRKLPVDGESETDEQREARGLVEGCLQKSFAFKLGHGTPIIKVMGISLGLLWRQNVGSDDVPGTYAHWFRYAMANWSQDALPEGTRHETLPPLKIGRLLDV